jgi:preprotein translocase subunit YajC
MLNLLFPTAMAQEATNAAAQPNPLMSMAPFLIIFIIFYFLMIRPQKKKMQKEAEMVSALKEGDKIYTKSGILGTIAGGTEKIVNLEIASGVKIKILRSEIGGLEAKVLNTEEKKEKK